MPSWTRKTRVDICQQARRDRIKPNLITRGISGGTHNRPDCSSLVRMAARSTAKDSAPNPKKTQAPAPDLDDPSLYVNRELGLLSFQWRVLEEARDDTNPLLERVKFLAIVGSNLNEFFMVRVASLNAQLDAGIAEFGPDRMSPSAQLVAIRREVKRLVEAAH